MKVLSLKQPWAELVVSGKKSIELRKWNTKFRGEFLIHSSKSLDNEAMVRFGLDNLPCGFIIGKAKLIEVKNYKETDDFEDDKNKHLASEDWGHYGFVLIDAVRIKLIPAKGALGFWNFSLG